MFKQLAIKLLSILCDRSFAAVYRSPSDPIRYICIVNSILNKDARAITLVKTKAAATIFTEEPDITQLKLSSSDQTFMRASHPMVVSLIITEAEPL